MRSALLLLILLATGCGQSPLPASTPLRLIATAFIPENVPAAVALHVANDGTAPVLVDDLSLAVEYKTLLYDDEGSPPPDGFDYVVRLFRDKPETDGGRGVIAPGETITIAPGATHELYGAVQWAVPPGTSPMLAIVRAAVVPTYQGKPLLNGESFIIALQSEPGALEAVRQSTTTDSREAAAVVKALRAIPGQRSAAFDDLIQSIGAIANREI
jgi:hypothetical protein